MNSVQQKITAMFDCGDNEEVQVDGTDLLTIAEAIASIAEKIDDKRAMAIIEGLIEKHADAIKSDRISATMMKRSAK